MTSESRQELQRTLKSRDTEGSRVFLKADQEVAVVDVQRQVVAVRSSETLPMNSPVGESLSKGRVEMEVPRVQGLI